MLQSLPESVSTFGDDIDGVIRLIYWITGVWLVAAEGILFWFLLRYRQRKGKRASWAPGNTSRALKWILVPAAGVLVCDLFIEVASARVWHHVKEVIPEHDVLVRITGQQFAWRLTYPGPDEELDTADDFETLNEMHVPRGQVIRFQLRSNDVIHCFSVAELRLKQDIVPGRSIEGWFEATKEGTYTIACAELCGSGHTAMMGKLHVDSPAAYSAWTRQQQRR